MRKERDKWERKERNEKGRDRESMIEWEWKERNEEEEKGKKCDRVRRERKNVIKWEGKEKMW